MASNYIKKSFSIASGATASSDIFTEDLSGEFAICRIEITGTLTANTAFIEGATAAGGTYYKLYDEYDQQIAFTVQGNRRYRVKPQDYPCFDPVIRIGLSAGASGAVTGFVWFRKVS